MPLPLKSVDKLIRKAGAHRVSEKAAKELTVALEETAIEVAQEAIRLAEHAGRKTVKPEDIELAFRRMGPRQPGPEYPDKLG
jgi:histone H3/H4